MSNNIIMYIEKNKIEIKCLNNMLKEDLGAIVTFVGVVKNFNNNKKVKKIYYSVFKELMYSLLFSKCKKIIEKNKHGKIIIVQYEGTLYPGSINLIVGVSMKHRDEAFLYCREIIEFIKKKVPVWKKEFYIDKSFKWINI